MKVSLIAMAAALVTAGAPTIVLADNLFANDDKATPAAKTKFSVVDVRYRNKHDLQSIADNYDILGVDKKGKTASVLVDAVHKAELEDEYTVTVDEKSTAELQASVDQFTTAAAADGVYGTIPGYSCYRTVEGTYETAADFAANYPNLTEWNDIGDSWEKANELGGGHDIFALKLTNKNTNPVGGKPVFFANCAIHARELATAELCTRFAEMLVQGYDVDADITALLDHHEIHLILQTNPDGRKQVETTCAGGNCFLWRKNTNQNYCGPTSSSRGADLNRNFPFKWGGQGASTNQCAETYRGASLASEPETQAVLNYLTAIFPVNQRGVDPADSDPSPADAMGVALDIHSYSELVLWPWGDTETATGNGDQFATLGRKLAFYNGYKPEASIGLYPTTGTTIDHYYANFGVASILYELGTAFFQACSTFENTIVPDNLPSLLYAAKVARTPFMTPAGPDALNLSFGAFNTVNEGDSIVLTATIDDTRYETQNGVESSQNIASASMYIDTAPWEAGATPIAMSASDGDFDATEESVTGTIDTTAMTLGRHIVYVVGTDTAGNEGAYSATFLEVIVPTPNVLFSCEQTPIDGSINSAISTTRTCTMSSVLGQTGTFDLLCSSNMSGVTCAFDTTSPVTLSANGTETVTVSVDVATTAPTNQQGTIDITAQEQGVEGIIRNAGIQLGPFDKTPTVSTSSGPHDATYDDFFGAPCCDMTGSSCSTDTLVDGRAGLGPEPNSAANTIDSCNDGTSGSYHSDESLDSIMVESSNGNNVKGGDTIRVVARVWCWSTGAADTADIYYTATPFAPIWVYAGSYGCPGGGAQDITSDDIVLPTTQANSFMAVRVNFRYQGSQGSCTTGSYDDHDDLVFAVESTIDGTAAPTMSPTKAPSMSPIVSPTMNPSKAPSSAPTAPTANPTMSPSRSPISPTNLPSTSPTKGPSVSPSTSPSLSPTKNPTKGPSVSPTRSPSRSPSKSPSKSPIPPTNPPSNSPTKGPSASPSKSPSRSPSKSPSKPPTSITNPPSNSPTKCGARLDPAPNGCSTGTVPTADCCSGTCWNNGPQNKVGRCK